MKYVIDTSVEIKTFVQECDSGKAVRLRNEYHQGVHELIAPDTFPTEMGNVLMVLERFPGWRRGAAIGSGGGPPTPPQNQCSFPESIRRAAEVLGRPSDGANRRRRNQSPGRAGPRARRGRAEPQTPHQPGNRSSRAD